MASQKTASIDTAKECVQDVFLSLYHRKHELQTTSSLKAYLYTALQNKIYNHYQKQLTRLKHESAASDNFLFAGTNLSEEYESKELYQQIDKRIQELPPQCRKVFLMSREEQLSYKEIAERLNISVNTVDQHIQKALRILRISVGGMLLVVLWMKIFD